MFKSVFFLPGRLISLWPVLILLPYSFLFFIVLYYVLLFVFLPCIVCFYWTQKHFGQLCCFKCALQTKLNWAEREQKVKICSSSRCHRFVILKFKIIMLYYFYSLAACLQLSISEKSRIKGAEFRFLSIFPVNEIRI